MITLFILIYLISFAIHLIISYIEDRRIIFTVGDLIDEIEFYMWCPVINTIVLIALALLVGIIKIWGLTKLSILWEKFRNIKLK